MEMILATETPFGNMSRHLILAFTVLSVKTMCKHIYIYMYFGEHMILYINVTNKYKVKDFSNELMEDQQIRQFCRLESNCWM